MKSEFGVVDVFLFDGWTQVPLLEVVQLFVFVEEPLVVLASKRSYNEFAASLERSFLQTQHKAAILFESDCFGLEVIEKKFTVVVARRSYSQTVLVFL